MNESLIISDWNFNSETGRIFKKQLRVSPKYLGSEVEDFKVFMDIGFQLTSKTQFDHDVWKAWWNKEPLEIFPGESVEPIKDGIFSISVYDALRIKLLPSDKEPKTVCLYFKDGIK